MAGPFTCLSNPWCRITALEEEGCNTAAINHHEITINNLKTTSNTYHANDQKVPFPSCGISNVFTDGSVALRLETRTQS